MINVLSNPSIYSELEHWAQALYVTFGVIFILLGIWFMFLYKDQLRKQKISSIEADEKGYSHGSWKGYWMRNRAVIFAFLVVTFFIVGVAIIMVPFVN